MEDVCYTREAALEMAIEMEAKSIDTYKTAYVKIDDRRVKDLVKELALEELGHKYALERAFFEETVALHDAGENEGPSMNLSLLLAEKPLDAGATDQDVMIHAIHEEKRSADFYKKFSEQCGEAPMGEMFEKLRKDEENHLAKLEKTYESVFMKEM